MPSVPPTCRNNQSSLPSARSLPNPTNRRSKTRSPTKTPSSRHRATRRKTDRSATPYRLMATSRAQSALPNQRGCYRAAVPWQNPYVERLIGSIRRECLDHIIIFNEHHLRGVLSRYFSIPSQDQDASLAKQGLSAASPHTTSLCRQDHRLPGGRRFASSLRMTRCMSSWGDRNGMPVSGPARSAPMRGNRGLFRSLVT